MAYYTATYRQTEIPDYEKIVDETLTKKFVVTYSDTGNRFTLYARLNGDTYRLAECFSNAWKNTYSKSVARWANSVKEKDIKKIEKLKSYIKEIYADIKTIESIW